MKLKYLKEIEGTTVCYGYYVKTGSVVDLDGHLAKKALNTGDWEAVDIKTKVTAKLCTPTAKEVTETLQDTVKALREEIDDLKAKNKQLKLKNKNLREKISGN